MDYPLENLGPDRFQELCQSLLAKLLPDIQCFPLFQSDGGRDALLPSDKEVGEHVVFQVKFLQDPKQAGRLLEAIKKEIPKIKKLANAGVKKYYLLTNVRGTGKSGSGSIDTVSNLLDSLPISAQCWWRNDICCRLHDAWNIKLSFPEILRNIDLIRLMVQGTDAKGRGRRESALRAFLEDQYERDKELRFKQIELRSEILDLFIDVPVELPAYANRAYAKEDRLAGANDTVADVLTRVVAELPDQDVEDLEPFADGRLVLGPRLGAASFLLHPLAQDSELPFVIEGAPGQGKSTIAQYVCQIHRHKLLGRSDGRIDSMHDKAPVRLPFRIECRDLDAWISDDWPFAEGEEVARKYPIRSVESYLAAQIAIYSGGASFDVDDLIAIYGLMPVLIFHDGLDEVADIKHRRRVVDEIIRSTNRISGNAQSLQTIVTSRPVVFANSPELPEKTFPHLALAPIGTAAIKEYARRWLKALKLSPREERDVHIVLNLKLDQIHIRELARNAMQLSILLSLIRSHGSSLPEMRTALYDSYVEKAFNREAEKSIVVRDNRDLFINIHRHVAWTLHSGAETNGTRGRIQENNLRELVQTYLIKMGYEDLSVDELFSGMVERIVALVSRVEGTFEFEVQPLREYFAAKYLYVTAPYSPPGTKMGGTKPDRFDAMACNFYWQNVTRFYAGCYDQGELPALVDSLNVLANKQWLGDTGYAQTLAATLLADRVFKSFPRMMKRVISIVLDGNGLRQLVSRRHRDIATLPTDCGGEELVERCFDLLIKRPPEDFRRSLIGLINMNSTVDERIPHWRRRSVHLTSEHLTNWMESGLYLDVVTKLAKEDVDSYLAHGVADRLWFVARAGRGELVERDEGRLGAVIALLLGGRHWHFFGRDKGLICTFASVLSPRRYAIAFRERTAEPLETLWSRYYGLVVSGEYEGEGLDLQKRCEEYITLSLDLSREYTTLEWSTTLKPWKKLVSKGRTDFGERWIWFVFANLAAGIRSTSVRGAGATRLFDESVDLCERVRYARLQSGRAWWWERQISEYRDPTDRLFALLVFFSWAGKSTLVKLAETVDRELRCLDSDEWMRLHRALASNEEARYLSDARWVSIDFERLPRSLSYRFAVAMSSRVRHQDRLVLYERYVVDYRGDEICTLEFCQWSALYALRTRPSEWVKWVAVISRTYSRGVVADQFFGYGVGRRHGADWMPKELVEEVIGKSERYPLDLVGAVYDLVRTNVAAKARPLGDVAKEEGWFDDGP